MSEEERIEKLEERVEWLERRERATYFQRLIDMLDEPGFREKVEELLKARREGRDE